MNSSSHHRTPTQIETQKACAFFIDMSFSIPFPLSWAIYLLLFSRNGSSSFPAHFHVILRGEHVYARLTLSSFFDAHEEEEAAAIIYHCLSSMKK